MTSGESPGTEAKCIARALTRRVSAVARESRTVSHATLQAGLAQTVKDALRRARRAAVLGDLRGVSHPTASRGPSRVEEDLEVLEHRIGVLQAGTRAAPVGSSTCMRDQKLSITAMTSL
jgi:hypothetical protein